MGIRSKASEQLISADTHTNTANFKYAYSIEIVPVCKDDLLCIPLKLARQLSNISPLTLCTRVGNALQLLDPSTLQSAEIPATLYWRTPFESLANVTDLREFTVLDVEIDGRTRGRFVLADVQVALNGAFRSSGDNTNNNGSSGMDYYDGTGGTMEQIYHTRTHLGGILQPGDTVMGFFLTHANYNSDDFASLPPSRIPDIVLVRKAYPNRRKKTKSRNWQLRSIAKEAGEEGETSNARGAIGRMGGRDQKKVEEDYEIFLRDLEEDSEMRATVNLYKKLGQQQQEDVKMDGAADGGAKPTKGGRKKVAYEMDIDEAPVQQQEGGATTSAGAAGENEEEEPDFPEVKLEELLENFDEMALGDNEETQEA